MLILGTLLGGLFQSLFSFFGQFLVRRVALMLVIITAMISATAVFMVAILSLFNALLDNVPGLNIYTGLFMPDHWVTSLGGYFAAHVLRFGYLWQLKLLSFKSKYF